MADMKASQAPAVIVKKKTASKLYWAGALPKAGAFKYKRSSLDQTAILNDNSEYCKYEDATALALWNKWEIWTGKCRYAQNITVHGHEYVAYINRPITQTGNTPGTLNLTFDPCPGMVVKWTGERLEAIVDATFKTFQREANGKDDPRNNALTTRFLNFEFEHSRDHLIDQSGKNPYTMSRRSDSYEYSEETDTSVSEFVYVVELDADPATKPEDYWTLPRTTMDQFFANPPKSLAETWKKQEARA